MAPGPHAAAATPPRVNPVYQEIIDTGTPILLSSPPPPQPANKRTRHLQMEPIARPDLQHAGRPHKAPHTPIGLTASIYAQSNYTATDSLTQVLGKQDRRLNAKRSVLKLITRSLDNITATCEAELKAPAEEIIALFTEFLKATVLEPENQSSAQIPGGKTWAQTASTNHGNNTSKLQGPELSRSQTTDVKGKDLRIFARIPLEYREWTKKHTSFALRHTICKQLDIPISDIPDVHHIATGLAIRPKDQTTKTKILAKLDSLGKHLKAT